MAYENGDVPCVKESFNSIEEAEEFFEKIIMAM